MKLDEGSAEAPAPPTVRRNGDRPSLAAGRNRDIVVLVLLFVCLRLSAVVFLHSGGNLFQGDHDFRFFRSIGELSLEGHFPYLDYWMEYPPLFPWTIVGVYWLSLFLPSWPDNIFWFQVLLSMVLVLADVGNLILIYRLAGALRGPRAATRAAWMYALLFFPLFVTVSWFDTIPLFFLLLAMWLGLRGRAGSAGVAVGLGFLMKIVPIVAAPVVFLGFTRLSTRARFGGALAATIGAVATPLLAANPTMFLASARFIATRQSWETIWAMIEGYGGIGRVPPLAARFGTGAVSFELHPSTLPWGAIIALFLMVCLWLYTRRLDWQQPGVAIPAVALTLNLFLLFSKGYSPQFLLYPLAMLVIVLPTGWGAVYAVLLTAVGLLEWPWAFGFFADDQRLLWIVIVARTGLLLWVSAEYLRMLVGRPTGMWSRLRIPIARAVVGTAVIAVAVGGTIAVGHYLKPTRPTDADALASYLTTFSEPDQAAIAASRDGFYQIRPLVPAAQWTVAEGDEGQWPTPIESRLAALRDGRARVWLILDQQNPNASDAGAMTRSLDAWGSPATDTWFGRYHLLGYVEHAPPIGGPRVPRQEVFGGALALTGYDLSAQTVVAGQGLALSLYLTTESPPTTDLKAFVHLEDSSGKIVSQRDRPLPRAGDKQSVPAQAVREGFDLLVPATVAPGQYSLSVGLYDPATGKRPPITAGPSAGSDQIVLGRVTVRAE